MKGRKYNFVNAAYEGIAAMQIVQESHIGRATAEWFALVGRIVAVIVRDNPTINRRYATRMATFILSQA